MACVFSTWYSRDNHSMRHWSDHPDAESVAEINSSQRLTMIVGHSCHRSAMSDPKQLVNID